jgi:O-antigen biosynthesis protein WbqV
LIGFIAGLVGDNLMPVRHLRTTIDYTYRLAVDAALSGAAFFIVTMLPLVQSGKSDVASLLPALALYVVASLPALYVMRTYRTIWRYTSFRDFLRLIAAAILTMLGFLIVELVVMHPDLAVPGALLAWTIVLVSVANIGFLAAPRFLFRAVDEALNLWQSQTVQSRAADNDILLIGDADRMEAFIRSYARDRSSRYRVVGVLTDDVRLHGRYLQGVPVLGGVENLATALASLGKQGQRPHMLVVATNDTSQVDFTKLLRLATAANIKMGRLPPLGQFTDNAPVRPIEVSDLLGRPEIKIDMQAVAAMIVGKCVMVTGGGGSIGSELSRQIARLKPSRLIVLDFSEFNLYSIDAELAENHPEIPRETALVDVRDGDLVSHWIGRTRPSIVFHAAALKHVPLIEDHPIEGIKTNVMGTINVAEACRAHRIPAMVMISTDKAVNPTNVMGATKRLAEAYCQGLDLAGDAAAITRFIMVRFGNVLGSAGSVVPLFRRQIKAGGPVTVTHPDITRYFMTIPEAVTLVMMAGAQGMEQQEDRGNIYLLDMGEPVKIMDLARQMIRLSGRRPEVDIKIKIIGLRPGEKLFEELSYLEETVQPTRSKSILKLMPRATDLRIVRQQVQELRQACANEDLERALRVLKNSVPDYKAGSDQRVSSF